MYVKKCTIYIDENTNVQQINCFGVLMDDYLSRMLISKFGHLK